ncbi:MAG: hypothetical protein APR63_12825 [Desulfuromonas sp. SDB]|nr:MAG: hypothetical protein APR63_12825 [Desulfuromonas sp. SDB]
MIRTQIQLTEKQAEALKKLSSEKDVSISELIRRGVDLLLKTDLISNNELKKKNALKLSGLHKTGCKNLSTHHDYYIYEDNNK